MKASMVLPEPRATPPPSVVMTPVLALMMTLGVPVDLVPSMFALMMMSSLRR